MKHSEFLAIATAILDKREAKAAQSYYLAEDDACEDYCLDCIRALNPDGEPGDFYYHGGCPESDSCMHCNRCGKLLDYTLTDYGVDSETEHFLESGWDWSNPNDCYHLARVAHGVYTADQKRKLIEALRIGKNRPDELKQRRIAA